MTQPKLRRLATVVSSTFRRTTGWRYSSRERRLRPRDGRRRSSGKLRLRPPMDSSSTTSRVTSSLLRREIRPSSTDSGLGLTLGFLLTETMCALVDRYINIYLVYKFILYL